HPPAIPQLLLLPPNLARTIAETGGYAYGMSDRGVWVHLYGSNVLDTRLAGGARLRGHGETYRHPQDIMWWSKGGVLHGRSPARIAFLRKVLEEGPAEGLEPIDKWQDLRTAGKRGEYYLVYLGKDKPAEWVFELPRAGLNDPLTFQIELLDTWEMTVTPVSGVFRAEPQGRYVYTCPSNPRVKLPGKPYLALRIRKVP
ncbi:MAG TPA: DUF5605 domain-containing protein, partial [Gemmataceae bacterium]|nr:DUF5605 domain-containing protein [Gemmataceae bacterium]